VRLLLAATLTGAVALPGGAKPVGDPELLELLERAGRYVVEYEKSFHDIVAEEEYVQRTETSRRVTRADLVFVHFRVSRGDTTATITTTFRPVAALAMWVPDEMKERYEIDSGGGTGAFAFGVSGCTGCYTEAVARYTRVRRFEVTTDEKARVPQR
jgi:hypothetical protein